MGLLTITEYSNDIVKTVEREFTVTIYDGTAPATQLIIDACHLKSTVDQSIPDDTETAVLWDAEREDALNMHSLASDTQFINILRHGYYLVSANGIEFDAHANGFDQVWVYDTDFAVPLAHEWKAGNATLGNTFNMAFIAHLGVGAQLGVKVKQNSGGAINLLHNDNGAFPNFSVVLLKDLTGVA